jgi:hypothetical protein
LGQDLFSETQPNYLVVAFFASTFLGAVVVVAAFLGAVVDLAAGAVVDLATGFFAGVVVFVEDACALAPSVIRAAAKTRARLLKLFIVFCFLICE